MTVPMRAVVVEEFGPAENLKLVELPKPVPRPGEVIVKVAFCGVNFIDVYFRTGLYKVPPPVSIGSEASGIVDAIGDGVTDLRPGDRVAYAMVRGAYAEYASVPAAQVVKIPAAVSLEQAAAVLLQGMTAHYLTRSTFPLKAGDTCLVHAAAGGTGALVVQMAHHIGARVFGTVSTPEKAAIARAAGADEVIFYTEQDFAAVKVKNAAHGTANPNARYRKQFTAEEVFASAMVADPLRLLHVCATSDGGAAVVISSMEYARRRTRSPVRIAAISTVTPRFASGRRSRALSSRTAPTRWRRRPTSST